MILSAIFLLTEVGRAWNGLAFNDICERLGVFIFFAVGLLFFPRSKRFNERIIFGALTLALVVLIAPNVISLFVPEQNLSKSKRETNNYQDNYQEIQLRQNQNSFVPEFGLGRGTSYEHEHNNGPCIFCSGTGNCHVCYGLGYSSCNGLTCINGRCMSCKGSGLYDHGTYVSRCIVCGGGGICNICNGTRKVTCSLCNGNGKCSNCNGTGKKS